MGQPLDVLVIGAGVAGALVAWRLAEAGAKVAVLEAGPRVDRAAAVERFRGSVDKTPESAYEVPEHAPQPLTVGDSYLVQDGPDLFKSTYERRVGGTTWHWLGTALRHLPADFRLQSRYDVGYDWPIAYDELEAWYGRAEQALGVAGDDDDVVGSPRSTPYPLPPIKPTYLDQQVATAVAPLGIKVRSTPQARNSQDFDGRPACCGNASCIPICPIGAKYDAAVHTGKAEAAGARLIENAVAYFIEVGPEQRVTAVHVKRPDGQVERYAADHFVLAANAIESPKLLLISLSERTPAGVANSSDQVGRNLMDHPSQLSWALAERPLWPYRGPLETSGIEDGRDGAFRRHRAAFRTPLGNDGWAWPGDDPGQLAQELIDRGLRGAELNRTIRDRISRQLRLLSLCEQLGEAENRVRPAFDRRDKLGIPRPRITYRVDDYTRRGMAEAVTRHQQIFRALNATEINHRETFEGAGHIMGTLRMGSDRKTSVVDAQCRAYDHPNLWIVGSAVFPSCGTANPTLTIASMALRCAAAIDRARWS
jgi:glucose dehydrogenase